MYRGSQLRWRLRRGRRLVHRPISWYRHLGLPIDCTVIASYPRSGSTWLTIMLAELKLGGSVGFAEVDMAAPGVHRLGPSASRTIPSSGFVRTHEPYRSAYGRSIYLVRDPRDVVVSYFHYRRSLGEYRGDIGSFVSMFTRSDVDSYGRWGDHVESWLGAPEGARLVVRYEDLRAETFGELRRICEFVGLAVESDALNAVIESNSLARMRDKEARSFGSSPMRGEGQFVRSGRSGEWDAALSQADVAVLEASVGALMSRLGYAPTFYGGSADMVWSPPQAI